MKTNEERGVPEWRAQGVSRNQQLGVGWRAGICFSLFQVFENLANDSVLGNEGEHAEGASTLTFQRVGLVRA